MIRSFLTALALLLTTSLAFAGDPQPAAKADAKPAPKTVDVGTPAPTFKIKDTAGNEINLAELTAKGPVLVRLTCGCSGCDKELAYFQAMHEAYKGVGLTSLAVFRMPDTKIEAYAKEKKLNMLYAVDPKGDACKVFETTKMPTNFLIAKGGKIISIAAGCDTSGLLAETLSEKIAKAVNTDVVDVQKKVKEEKAAK
jgi:peroxiredoxin